jgi:hypothetical protein
LGSATVWKLSQRWLQGTTRVAPTSTPEPNRYSRRGDVLATSMRRPRNTVKPPKRIVSALRAVEGSISGACKTGVNTAASM